MPKPNQEILSHSSIKTNDRLDKWFSMLDSACLQAWNSTKVTTKQLQEYHACLITIYNTLYPLVYNKKDEKSLEIDKFICEFSTKLLEIYKIKDIATKQVRLFKLRESLTYSHRYLYSVLQRQEYFFKIGQRGAHGFEEVMDNLQKKFEDAS